MQRVALARSIVYRRSFCVDEPLSNLDAKLRLRLRDDLRVILSRPHHALSRHPDQAEAVVLGTASG